MKKTIVSNLAAIALTIFACSSESSEEQPSSSSAQPSSSSSMFECIENPHQPFDPDLYECKPSINPYAIYLKNGVKDASGNHSNAALIGAQVWMAENLNLATDREGNEIGRCFEDKPENCDKFGRMYILTPNGTDSTSEGGEIECPEGFRLPSSEDLTILLQHIDPTHEEGSVQTGRGKNQAGPKLKARTGWPPDYDGTDGNGTDDYGFNALPGGYCGTGCGSFEQTGEPTWSILYPPVAGSAATSSTRANSSIFFWTTSKGQPVPLAITWRISSGVIVDDAFQSYNNSRFYARCLKEAEL